MVRKGADSIGPCRPALEKFAVEDPSWGEGRGLLPAEPFAMLGRANTGRGWLCRRLHDKPSPH
jgi:hypothetical protein